MSSAAPGVDFCPPRRKTFGNVAKRRNPCTIAAAVECKKQNLLGVCSMQTVHGGRQTMRTCKSLLLIPAFVLMFMITATAANAPLTFKFTNFKVPGALTTAVMGINNSGVVVGQYQAGKGVTRGFKLNGGKLTRIDHPKGSGTICRNINSSGAIVGSYVDANGTMRGFLYQNGNFTEIPGPAGAKSSEANGINDNGLIVGAYGDSKDVVHGFLLTGKKYKTLDVHGANATTATGINNKDHIVLYWLDSMQNVESSFYNGKTYTTINVPGATNSYAEDLNNADDVVYYWLDNNLHPHGALRHTGKYHKFDHPKSMETWGMGISDNNVVAGPYTPINNYGRGFTATY
jgi:uncharacterized membrane protein